MKMDERKVGRVMVLDLSGRIVAGEGTALLRNAIADLTARGEENIVLNLARVPYIDSAGIGELVSSFVAVRRKSGSLKLLNPTRRVREVLEIVKLLTAFQVFDNEADALATFGAPQARMPEFVAV